MEMMLKKAGPTLKYQTFHLILDGPTKGGTINYH